MTIPGTQQPFKVYDHKGPPPLKNSAEAMQRRGLLAKIHIAKKEMGLNEGEYEMILKSFKVASSADMTLRQLENMVKLLKHYGWKPTTPYPRQRGRNKNAQIEALRKRVLEEAQGLTNWENRLAGLVKSICGVAVLNWVDNVAKLERLIAVIGSIKEKEQG